MSDYRTLTPSRLKMIDLISRGDTNLQIAEHLGCAEDSVKTHVARMSGFLGARSRAHLVWLAIARGHLAVDPVEAHITISPRRLQAVALVAAGHTNLQIAESLHVTENTVKTLLRKSTVQLGARNRAHLIRCAYSQMPASLAAAVPPEPRRQPKLIRQDRVVPQPLFVKRGLIFMAAGGAR